GRHQGLKLEEEGPRPFQARDDDRARGVLGTLREEEAGRVRDLVEALLSHLEHADLVGRAEAILDGPEDAGGMVALALEVEHGVHEVLEDAWPRQRSLLGNVTDQERRDARTLREHHESRPALPHLTDAARR